MSDVFATITQPISEQLRRLEIAEELSKDGKHLAAIKVLTDRNYCPHLRTVGFECQDCFQDFS
jgi:hypothetical protein